MYKIKLHPKVEKALRRYPKVDQVRIAEAIRALAANPRPSGALHLRDVLYRIRVGEYRLLYAVFDQALVVVVIRAGRRNERTYTDLQLLVDRAHKLLDSESDSIS